jgi:hypothetical protein
MTSGTPPARKNRTVGWPTGPLGKDVDEPRDAAIDAAPIVDRRTPQIRPRRRWPARASSRFVDPPQAAWTAIAFSSASSVRMSRVVIRLRASATTARAAWRAALSQIGCPEGARAVWGNASPSASATTCDVAAVPEKLATASRRAARAATHVGRVFERDVPFGESERRSTALCRHLPHRWPAASLRRER